MKHKNLTFIDIETTGTSATRDRIIEISMIRVENGRRKKTFTTFIDPEISLPPGISLLTGINQSMLSNAPSFRSVSNIIRDLLDDSLFVAHNARFDYSFIKNEFRRLDESFSAETLCTVKLFRKLYPEVGSYNLDTLIRHFSLRCTNRHRAYDDANALVNFYHIVRKLYTEASLNDAIDTVMKKKSLPAYLSPDAINQIPETPGVYIFYGENKTPLYVGKSINLKERILSHFASALNTDPEMTLHNKIRSVETIDTPGELSALLLESTLVKKLNPSHNRKLRKKHVLFVAQKTQTSEGYETADLHQVEIVNPDDIDSILGVYRSKRQAHDAFTVIAKQYSLCHKLLGLENTSGRCFLSHLGICKGACIGAEKPLAYNIRFTEAFSATRVRQWPFEGPIIITETHPEKPLTEKIVFDRWCLIGANKKIDQDIQERKTAEYAFDLDTYHILVNYIFNPKNQRSIKVLRALKNQDLFNYSAEDTYSD